jgi:hypothetical protein
MHVAFLTLLRTPERAEAILRELHRAGFKGIRCHLGVDAAEGIEALPWWRPARERWLPQWGRLEPVIACAESHLRIYSTALKRGEPALIFEDDTRLLAPATEFHSAVAEAPEGWDLIHFHGPAHYDGIVERTEGHTARLRALSTVGFGAVAYAVSPAGIYKIMRAAYPLDRPIDVTIREVPNLRAYRTARPFALRDGAFKSGLR